MRMMFTFIEMSYNPEHWEKLIQWGDPDNALWRGSITNEKGEKNDNVVPDNHIMFVLRAKQTPAKMNLKSLPIEARPHEISVNQGGEIFVGNGFVYFDTKLCQVETEQ